MTRVQILYWHDIPLQVRVGGRRDRVSRELSPRFQAAVDQAAMVAQLTGSEAYLDGFAWQAAAAREGEPAAVAEAVVAELEAAYPKIDWRATAERLRS